MFYFLLIQWNIYMYCSILIYLNSTIFSLNFEAIATHIALSWSHHYNGARSIQKCQIHHGYCFLLLKLLFCSLWEAGLAFSCELVACLRTRCLVAGWRILAECLSGGTHSREWRGNTSRKNKMGWSYTVIWTCIVISFQTKFRVKKISKSPKYEKNIVHSDCNIHIEWELFC